MINLREQIEKLQKQPYEVRVRILWTTVIACAAILLVIWVISIKGTFKDIDKTSLIQAKPAQSTSAESKISYIAIERVEKTSNTTKIFFNIDNPTSDILNFSKLNDITLTISGQSVHPKQIFDRQGQTFVQKVLSHTTAFGTLTFDRINNDKASLEFDQLFFEQKQTDIFKQVLDLDLNKLNTDSKLRN